MDPLLREWLDQVIKDAWLRAHRCDRHNEESIQSMAAEVAGAVSKCRECTAKRAEFLLREGE